MFTNALKARDDFSTKKKEAMTLPSCPCVIAVTRDMIAKSTGHETIL